MNRANASMTKNQTLFMSCRPQNIPRNPKAKGRKTPQADFDRNRDGLYGGLPKARDNSAPGPASKQPHPSR